MTASILSNRDTAVAHTSNQELELPTKRPRLLVGQPLSEELQWYIPPRRPYSRRELLADRIVNFLGAGISWLAAALLVYASWAAGDPFLRQLCFWVHGAGLVIMLNLSALYHFWAWDWKHAHQLLSLDHVGTSSMIAGSYAPIMQLCECYKVLICVCLLGAATVPMEVVRLRQLEQKKAAGEDVPNWGFVDKLHIARYLVMGWACLLVAPEVLKVLPTPEMYAAFAGGLLYTAGVPIFVCHSLEYHLAIWHFMVLLASACFYLGNLLFLVGLPAA